MKTIAAAIITAILLVAAPASAGTARNASLSLQCEPRAGVLVLRNASDHTRAYDVTAIFVSKKRQTRQFDRSYTLKPHTVKRVTLKAYAHEMRLSVWVDSKGKSVMRDSQLFDCAR